MAFAASVLCVKGDDFLSHNLFSTRILSLLVPETILIFSCYILAAYWLGGADPSVFLLYDNGLLQIALVVAGVLVGLQLNKLYAQVGVRSKILLLQQLCLTLGVTFLLESLLTYLRMPELVLAPGIMVVGSALTLAVLLVWRIFYSAALWKSLGAKRVLFLWRQCGRSGSGPKLGGASGIRPFAGRLYRRRSASRHAAERSVCTGLDGGPGARGFRSPPGPHCGGG